MATTDPKTIIDTNQDPGLSAQPGYRAATTGTDSDAMAAPPRKTVTIDYTDPPLYGVPELQIFNDPGGNTGAVQFNNANRLAGDGNFTWNSKSRTLSILGNLRVSNQLSGKITTNTDNFRLTGGNANAVLTTDGTGNLRWETIDISYGNSNVANYLPTYTGNLAGGNVKTDNLLYANGVAWNLNGTYSNANVASYLPTFAGNITANHFIGDGSLLTGLPATYANSNVANYLPNYTGNLNGANLNISNTAYLYNMSATGIATLTTININSSGTLNANTDQLKFAGGTSGQVLSTDGDGNVSWIDQTGGTSTGDWSFSGNTMTIGENGTIRAYVTSGYQPNITIEVDSAEISPITYKFTSQGLIFDDGTITTGSSITSANAFTISTNELDWVFDPSGNLTLPGNVFAINYANGAQVDLNAVAIVSNTAPNSTVTGEVWWNTVTGRGYVMYDGQWVDMSPAVIPDIEEFNQSLNTTDDVEFNNLTVIGEISARMFVGDGSRLSNLPIPNNTILINDNAPSSAIEGTVWFNSEAGRSFVKYDEQWVDMSPMVLQPLDSSIENNGFELSISNTGKVEFPGSLNVNESEWTFGTDGTLTVPGLITRPADETLLLVTTGSNGNSASISIDGEFGRTLLRTYDGETLNTWELGIDGSTIYPTLDVQRGDTSSDTITGQTLLFGDGTQEAIITTPNGSADTSDNSQRLVINPGQGFDSGEGGDIYLWAGRGGDTDGNGGDIKIRGGYGPGNGQAGYIRIEGGNSAGTGDAGTIEITGGQGGDTVGGYVRIQGGQGATSGGDANIQGGYGGDVTGGNVNIIGGGSGAGLSGYGNVNIGAGASSWKFDNTGNLTLPSNSFKVNYANGTQVTIGGGSANTGNVTFDDVTVQGDNTSLNLSAGADFTANLAYLQVRAGDVSTHIHLDTGNNDAYDQYFGNDNKFVKLGLGTAGNVSIGTYQDGGIGQLEWTFDSNGNLVLPKGGVVYETNIPFGGLDGNTIALKPSGGTNDDQQLLVYPTAGQDFNHLHLTSGNLYNTELFLGNDDLYVKIANTGNIVINSNDGVGNTAQWTFDTTGTIVTSGDLTLQIPSGTPSGVSDWSGQGGWNQGFYGNLATTGGTGTGLTVDVAAGGGGYININAITIHTPGSGYTDGDVITIDNENNLPGTFVISVVSKTWDFETTGILTLPYNNYIETEDANLSLGSQSNVTIRSNAATVESTNSWVFDDTGNLTIPGSSGGMIKTVANGAIGITAINNGSDNPAQMMSWTVGETNPDTIISTYSSNASIMANVNGTIKTWEFTNTGNLKFPDNTVQTTAWTGTVAVANVTGLGNISTANLDGNASNVLYGNGSFSTLPTMYSNTDVASYLSTNTANVANLIVSGAVPSTLLGSSGDTAGMIRADSNYFYYCTNTFVPSTWTVGWEGSTSNTLFITKGSYPTPQVGWTVDFGGFGPWTIATVTDNGTNWQITWVGTSFGSPGGGTATLTNPSPATIWKQTPLAATVYGNSNATSLLASFGSNTISTTGNVTGGNLTTTGTLNATTAVLGNSATVTSSNYSIGYRDMPQIAASNTTLAATDGGKHYYSATAANFTLTIPNNTTTSFSTGTAISIVVQAAGNILVNAASGVTLYMAGNSTAANRYVNAYGMATLLKVGTDTWFINGTGVN